MQRRRHMLVPTSEQTPKVPHYSTQAAIVYLNQLIALELGSQSSTKIQWEASTDKEQKSMAICRITDNPDEAKTAIPPDQRLKGIMLRYNIPFNIMKSASPDSPEIILSLTQKELDDFFLQHRKDVAIFFYYIQTINADYRPEDFINTYLKCEEQAMSLGQASFQMSLLFRFQLYAPAKRELSQAPKFPESPFRFPYIAMRIMHHKKMSDESFIEYVKNTFDIQLTIADRVERYFFPRFKEETTFRNYFTFRAHLTIPDFEQLAKINQLLTQKKALRDELRTIGFFGPDVPSIIADYAAHSLLETIKEFFYSKMRDWKPDDESASFNLEPKDFYELELLRNPEYRSELRNKT